MDEARLRQQLCQAASQLWTRGLIPGDGGLLSVELHRRRFLVTPPRVRRPNLDPREIVCVDMGGLNIQGAGGLSELSWRPHRAGYKLNLAEPGALMEIGPKKRTIAATVLAEPPIVMAMLRQREGEEFLEFTDERKVPVRTLDDESSIMSALRISPGVAIPGVGLLCCDADIWTAINWIERVDHLARIELAVGGESEDLPMLTPLTDDGQDEVIRVQPEPPRIAANQADVQRP